MRIRKLYEDVLDDLDEIRPDDVPEDDERYPLLREGFTHTIAVHHSMVRITDWNRIPDALGTYLDIYADNSRLVVLSSDEDMAEFADETGRAYEELSGEMSLIVIQFNARPENIYRLIFRIFSQGALFSAYIPSSETPGKFEWLTQVVDTFARSIIRSGKILEDAESFELASDMTTFVLMKSGNYYAGQPEWKKSWKVVDMFCKIAGSRKALERRARPQ